QLKQKIKAFTKGWKTIEWGRDLTKQRLIICADIHSRGYEVPRAEALSHSNVTSHWLPMTGPCKKRNSQFRSQLHRPLHRHHVPTRAAAHWPRLLGPVDKVDSQLVVD